MIATIAHDDGAPAPPVCPHHEVPEQSPGNSRASLGAERHIRTDACSLLSGRASGHRRRGEAGPDHMDARCSNHSALNCARIDLPIVRPLRVAVGMFAASWPIPFPSHLTELAQRGLDLACLTGNRLRLARLVATAGRNFLPLRTEVRIPRKQESPVPPSSMSLRSLRAHPIAQAQRGPRGDARRSFPVSSTAIEAAMGAARNIEKE